MIRRRRGRAYDPEVVDTLLADAGALLEHERGDLWERLFALEPQPVRVSPARLDGLLEVMADFADLKMPAALGPLPRRGRWRRAPRSSSASVTTARADCAARRLVHDLGRCGVSTGVWERAGPLSADDWERVRLHAYLTERILARTPLADDLAALAGAHHERLDGSGYHRGARRSPRACPPACSPRPTPTRP